MLHRATDTESEFTRSQEGAYGSSVRSAFKSYLLVHPVGMRNAVRLYAGYVLSLLMKLLVPSRFKSVGYLIPGRSELTVSVAGILASIRPHTVDLGMLATSLEPQTRTWFQVKPGDIVADVGAHIGSYTLMAAKYALKVIAVEPEPSNFSMLRSNIRLNGFSNVVALRLSLSRNRGRMRFYLANEGDTATSSLEQDWKTRPGIAKSRKVLEVESETLDGLSDSLDLQLIDWLKIDVEGHEVAVLQGASKTLRRTRRIIMEVSDGNEKICESLLRDAGFIVVATERMSLEQSNWLVVNETLQILGR